MYNLHVIKQFEKTPVCYGRQDKGQTNLYGEHISEKCNKCSLMIECIKLTFRRRKEVLIEHRRTKLRNKYSKLVPVEK